MYERFEALLEKNHKSAYKVANDTGIRTSTLSAWKKGEYTPKIDKLQTLADYFGVDITYFIGKGG